MEGASVLTAMGPTEWTSAGSASLGRVPPREVESARGAERRGTTAGSAGRGAALSGTLAGNFKRFTV